MQARQELIQPLPDLSFRAFALRRPAFVFQWHQHPEIELTLITRGRGLRIAGDGLEPYEAPDLVLLGPNLPHAWRTPGDSRHNEAIVIQFRRDFMGEAFFERPEFRAVAALLEAAARGLAFPPAIARALAPRLRRVLNAATGLARLRALLECLEALAADGGHRSLASPAYRSAPRTDQDRERRVARACEYISGRLGDRLPLGEVARYLHMTPSAFSRFFKRATGMTFIRYLQERRIGEACRLLMDTDERVLDICGAVGFSNLSNFNRRFRALRGQSPRDFRRRLRV